MIWLIGLLTFILVVNCLFLCLLVLAQKPKKDTGGGLAFGGGASDALFGAGSGDLFTKMTKYATVIFFILTLTLSILNAQQARRKGGDPRLRVSQAERQGDMPIAPKPVAAAAPNTPAAATPATNAALGTNNPLSMLSTKLTNPVNSATGTTTAPPVTAPATAKPKADEK
jgi:preprotein translocase subunit SecG